MQRVTDTDLPLDLGVREGRHDGSTLHVGATRRHVPGRHSQPQLNDTERRQRSTKELLHFRQHPGFKQRILSLDSQHAVTQDFPSCQEFDM